MKTKKSDIILLTLLALIIIGIFAGNIILQEHIDKQRKQPASQSAPLLNAPSESSQQDSLNIKK